MCVLGLLSCHLLNLVSIRLRVLVCPLHLPLLTLKTTTKCTARLLVLLFILLAPFLLLWCTELKLAMKDGRSLARSSQCPLVCRLCAHVLQLAVLASPVSQLQLNSSSPCLCRNSKQRSNNSSNNSFSNSSSSNNNSMVEVDGDLSSKTSTIFANRQTLPPSIISSTDSSFDASVMSIQFSADTTSHFPSLFSIHTSIISTWT